MPLANDFSNDFERKSRQRFTQTSHRALLDRRSSTAVKRLPILPFLPFVISVALAAAPTPDVRLIWNDTFQNDLDATTRNTRNLIGSELVAPSDRHGRDKEVWIAIREDRKRGSGTAEDPFDGSTQAKFDALLHARSIANTTNITIHLGPGIFQTTGSKTWASGGFFVGPGWKIIGVGMYNTTVQLSAYPSAAGANGTIVLDTSNTLNAAGAEVRDLTVDCNWSNLGAASGTKISAVSLHGNDCKIQRVRAINAYGNNAAGAESFPLVVGNYTTGGNYQNVTGALIENCVVSNFQGDYGTALFITADPSSTATTSGRMVGNRVFGPGYISGKTGLQGIGAAGNGIEAVGNVISGCSHGLNIDTGSIDNFYVHNNFFYSCSAYGVHIGISLGRFPHAQGVRIEDNYVQLTTDNPSTPIGIHVDGSRSSQTNFVIARNRITYVVTNSRNTAQNGIGVDAVTGLLIEQNTIDAHLNNGLGSVGRFNTDMIVRRNVDETGASPQNLVDSVRPLGP